MLLICTPSSWSFALPFQRWFHPCQAESKWKDPNICLFFFWPLLLLQKQREKSMLEKGKENRPPALVKAATGWERQAARCLSRMPWMEGFRMNTPLPGSGWGWREGESCSFQSWRRHLRTPFTTMSPFTHIHRWTKPVPHNSLLSANLWNAHSGSYWHILIFFPHPHPKKFWET